MRRWTVRSTLISATTIAMAAGAPSNASAQLYTFNSCATPGVCGWVNAFFVGSLLTVQIANNDNVFGSALYSASLFFASPLNPGSPSVAFTPAATSTPVGTVASIGTTVPGGWFFDGLGGSNQLDLASFANVYIEGTAPSPYRGDPGGGTWETSGTGYVQFQADLSGVVGVNNGRIVGLGFCTDVNCVSGPAVLTPEPASLTLLATGVAALAVGRRRRKAALN